MDGLSAIAGIVAGSPTTRVVMFSGFDAASLEQQALARGAAAYVEKSTPIRELPDRLLRVLNAAATSGPAQADEVFARGSEAILAEHLERFRTVFDQAAIGMATLTLTGTLVRANEALANLLGRSVGEIVGRPLETFFESSAHEPMKQALRGAVASASAQQAEHRLAGQPEATWVHSTIAAVRDAEGRALYLFAQVQDITDRHDALEKLRASEERFRVMVESVRDYAIFMLDGDGKVSTWNLGAERLKGYRADEIIGQHFRNFYLEADQRRRHPEYELQVARRDGRYEEEGWRVRKDGTTFWANVVITPLFDDEGRHLGFAKVTRDMTERRAALESLAASNEELHDTAEQTEEFLAVIAHELQSPVAAITGATDILVDYWDRLDQAERRETLGRIAAGGERIRRLLDDLLTASRLDADTFTVALEPVAIADLIDRAVTEVSPVPDPIEVEGAEGIVVHADPTRVVQILTNLLTNALKYGAAPYEIVARRAGPLVEIRVHDGGRGAEPGLRERLFEKFAKTRTTTVRGTGLGLYIVRELARKQGGDAWYEPGHAFVFSLPAANDAEGLPTHPS